MNFHLTPEQKMVEEMVKDFATKEIKPLAQKHDEEGEFPVGLIKEMAELGLMGPTIPEEYGGAGMDNISYSIIMEEVARACVNTSVILTVNNSLVCEPILAFGNEEQKKHFLTPMAKGEKIGCFGLTEPEAGSDAASLQTTAKLIGDHWLINGQKAFITNATHADICLFFASTDKSLGPRGISAFVVEKGTQGFTLGKVEHKLGLNASGTAGLVFEDCALPKGNLVGKEGQGFKIAMQTLDGGRLGIGAQAVGIARAALEEATAYAQQRHQFKKPIASFQAIQWMLADMATEIDAARLLVRRAAFLKDNKLPFSLEAAMGKLFASETAMRATIKAVQIFGGYGYSKEYPVERLFREAKVTEIYEGTSEIQRLVIAANVLKKD